MAQQQGPQAQTTIKVLTKYKKYEAMLKLSGIEAIAPNEMVASKIREIGFTNVTVNGQGSKRTAIGVWSGETQPITEMPKQIIGVKEL